MNGNFVFPVSGVMAVPYCTLGGGILWSPIENITISSAIYNSTDSSTTSGFQDIGAGTTWSTEFDLQYQLGDFPGGVNVGGGYAWNGDFRQIGKGLVVTPRLRSLHSHL